MLLSSPHLDQKVSQEPVDADALDTLLESAGWSERMPYTACTYIKLVYIKLSGGNGEYSVHATDATHVRIADTQYPLQEVFALLPQLFCSNVFLILIASLQLSVPPLDAPGGGMLFPLCEVLHSQCRSGTLESQSCCMTAFAQQPTGYMLMHLADL